MRINGNLADNQMNDMVEGYQEWNGKFRGVEAQSNRVWK